MNRLFERLAEHAPDFFRKRQVTRLCRGAAAAFSRPVPIFRGLRSRECLEVFAEFVSGCVEDSWRRGSDLESIQVRLFQFCRDLGEKVRKISRISRIEEAMMVGRILYRWLEIDLDFSDSGEILIRRCFFSRYFSPQVCRVMSAMDRGLLAGLTAGGNLVFHQRMTDGYPDCRACLVFSSIASSAEENGKP
jgi:hypothetical protein